MVCLGVSRKTSIGLDIVRDDSRYPFSATAEYLFTPGERQWITRAPSHEQQVQFFRIWSLKEALLKAMGSGVGMMQETEVSGIMKNHFLNGYYPVPVGKKERAFFIHESGCGTGSSLHPGSLFPHQIQETELTQLGLPAKRVLLSQNKKNGGLHHCANRLLSFDNPAESVAGLLGDPCNQGCPLFTIEHGPEGVEGEGKTARTEQVDIQGFAGLETCARPLVTPR